MSKKILITGGQGFLGQNLARLLISRGHLVAGIGHQNPHENISDYGQWLTSDISYDNLKSLNFIPDIIIHCAGGSSVSFSIDYPALDRKKTFDTSEEVLRFTKEFCPDVKLIYPSSAAVYGEQKESPIPVDATTNPISPYGKHKSEAEKLFLNERDLDCTVVRFFSLYGNGLRKQLIWDACQKLSKDSQQVVFWGTGEETRDWLHISDACLLIESLLHHKPQKQILQGASGQGVKTKAVIDLIKKSLQTSSTFEFSQKTRNGDPSTYIGTRPSHWIPTKDLEQGISEYVNWFKTL